MSDDKACTYTLEDGTHYDLSELSSGPDFEAVSGSDRKFFLNVCRGVKTELSNVEDASKVGGFYERPDGRGHFSIGEWTTNITLSPATNDPMLIYQHGSPCPSNDKDLASTAIRFVCSPTDFEAGKPSLVAALPPGDDACHFYFEWKTHKACATSRSASLEGTHILVFFLFVVVAIFTWFVGHTLYNRFVLGRRGKDQFPLPHINCARPRRLHLDDDVGHAHPAPRRWGFRRSGGYNHLQSHEEDQLTAARFSLTDDEDDGDARALGGEVDAWRGHGHGSQRTSQEGTVGAHQGLVNL